MLPLVSHFIICYNQADFIAEAMQSAIDQDYENLEVIVADDGSTDGTREIILEFAKRYPQKIIPAVGGPNLGITGNCNRALRYCRGTYISCQGGDDVLLPGKISRQVEWLEENARRVMCGHDVRVIFTNIEGCEHIRYEGKAGRSGTGARDIIREGVDSFYMGTSLMWRASATPPDGFDSRLHMVSDWKSIINIIGCDGEWGAIDGVYAIYRRHQNNITSVGVEKIAVDVFRTMVLLKHEYPMFKDEIEYIKVGLTYNKSKAYFQTGRHYHAIRLLKRLLAHKIRHPNASTFKMLKYFVKNHARLAMRKMRFLNG